MNLSLDFLKMSHFLDVFCKKIEPSFIWNGNDFGGCFEKLVIVSPVYVIITLICSYYIVKASCRPIASGSVNRAWVVYLRLILHFTIICTEIALVIEQFLASDNIAAVEIVAESFILLAWCLSAVVIFIWRRSWHSINFGRDFDILVASWFLALISCSVELHSAILSSKGHDSALDDGSLKHYECRNIFVRWFLYVGVLLSQIPRSHVLMNVNDDEEAGSSVRPGIRETQSEHSFSFLSRTSFHWVTKLFTAAQRSQFPTVDDLPFGLPPQLNPAANHCKFQLALRHFSQPPSNVTDQSKDELEPLIAEVSSNEALCTDKFLLVKALNRAFGWNFWPLNLIQLIEVIFALSIPVILNLFLHELENDTPNLTSAAVYLGLLVCISIVNAFVRAHLKFELGKLGMRIKGSLISELFSKVLNINSARLKSFNVGQVSNFATEDAGVISGHMQAFLDIWVIPLELIVTIVLLYHYIGIAVLSAVGFCIIVTPINIYITSRFEKCEDSLMKQRDTRLKLVHEIFSSIKTVKFFSWEDNLIKRLCGLRNRELIELRTIAYLDAVSVFIWAVAPSLITIITIGTYSLLGGEIGVSVLFTTLALIGQLIEPLNSIPWVLLDFVMSWVSIKRIQSFFSLSENSPLKAAVNPPLGENNVIEVDNCSFYWKDPNDFCLVGLSFQVTKGELMIVMGKTGSGKSSLLLALSQELNMASGELRLKEWREGAGIVLQECWIKSGTVRETILDGCVFDLYWYETVVSACALDKDIAAFPNGDTTPVGVNGSALSGGQRLRLTLARAVYKNKQVYLIDDIFSGLDIHVVHHIYEHCINGILANKTRVICTHNRQLCASARTLMVLDKGRVHYIGPPQMSGLPQLDEIISEETSQKADDDDEGIEKLRIRYEEPRSYGAVDSSVYTFYLKSASYTFSCFVIISLVLMQGTETAANIWLSVWTKAVSLSPGIHRFPISINNSLLNSTSYHKSSYQYDVYERFGMSSNTMYYLSVYAAIIGANLVCSLARVLSFVPFQLTATKALHNKMLYSVMQAPLYFFDKTPVGVIMNRFSSDIYSIDSDIPITINIFAAQACMSIGMVVLTCYGLPYILITFLPLSVVYFFIQRYYRRAVREVKRLYSMSQSPLFSHFEETLGGISYIHSFRTSESTKNVGMKILKTYQRAQYCMTAANVWLQLRLELITALVIAVASGIILIEMNYHVANASRLGLGLTFVLSINSVLDYLITSLAELEKDFVGAERVLEFTQNLPKEIEKENVQSADDTWPSSGTIQFSDVSVRYKDCETRALNNVTFTIKAGEKVAIVGRTGAGKSTVFLALFRLVELETGCITVDNVDIADLSNKVVRQSFTIIPQQALVFSGSIRDNMDPFGDHHDEEITSALEQCSLGGFLDSKGGLDFEISPGALSTGECQLLALARALLKKSKMVCLDEATSNIDMETDQLIQKLIRDNFVDCTVITIAHRIETVLDYDRVIVLSQGGIVEDGDPKQLLHRSSSQFYRLARSSGLVAENRTNWLPSFSALSESGSSSLDN